MLAISGADAEGFLQGQLSSDINALTSGAVQRSSYNSAKGRMLATLLLWRDGETFRALVAADVAEPLRKRLSMYILRAKVTVTDLSRSHALFGVGGAAAADAVRAALGAAPDPGRVIVDSMATIIGLEDGRFVVATLDASLEAIQAKLAAHATAVAPDVWRWLGIRAGVPEVVAATQDLFIPQTANWDLLGGVNFQKGCYPGQEIVARTQYLGRLKERMQLFHVDGPAPRPATKIYGDIFGEQACGTVVDAAPAPDGGSDLLAVLQLSALDGALRCASPDGPVLAPLPLPYAIPASASPNRPKL
jgi:folate-binding protein YgfZ